MQLRMHDVVGRARAATAMFLPREKSEASYACVPYFSGFLC